MIKIRLDYLEVGSRFKYEETSYLTFYLTQVIEEDGIQEAWIGIIKEDKQTTILLKENPYIWVYPVEGQSKRKDL